MRATWQIKQIKQIWQIVSFRENAYNLICGIVYMLEAGRVSRVERVWRVYNVWKETGMFENLEIERSCQQPGAAREGSFLGSLLVVRGSLRLLHSSLVTPSLVTAFGKCLTLRFKPRPRSEKNIVRQWDMGQALQ
jgi:hypothetical protein